jgi:D-3-phosphoglycerate dehydrogenase
MDNIDVEVAEERRIHCLNAPEGNRDSVAEQTIGMLLSLLNNLPKARRELEQGIWNRKGNSGTELSELCVGIIGYGNTGTSLAAKLKAFGCRIIAYDLHLKEFSSPGIEEVDLARLQSESDVISVHVPLDSSSRHLINGEFFRKLAKPIYLLNVSRGSVVETKALIQAFKEGKLRGAGLDVLENENLDSMDEEEKAQFEFLLNHPAVILSPHIAGLTSSSFFRLSDILSRRILEKMDEIHLLTQNRL